MSAQKSTQKSAQQKTQDSPRAAVRKTYKLYVGGAFPRSESGYSYPVEDAKGNFVANAALASRKDARDAVSAARKAFAGWSSRTAYNRGQVLSRIAEVLEDRRAQFVDSVVQAEGTSVERAEAIVDESIDRLVWYAGWTDKVTQVVGAANPVPAPTSTSPPPSQPVWSRWSLPRSRRCSGWSRSSPR